MPAVSKKQQRFMGMVHALNKGEIKPSDVSKDVQDVAKDMKKKDAKDFASTKHKGLPMKKEILNKLKEMIRQELSEYTYGVGDVVKDVNPTCLHYGAIGKVKEVNPKYVKFVVMNNGDRFKKGQTLEKSHDQMKKMNESINEFSIKLQKSTQDMVDALLKVKSPMPKEIESALIMMAKGYGLDYVKKEVQRDAKGFYKNLKQMAAAFPEFRNKPKDYKFESIIQERNNEVQTGKDYTKLWLQSIGLIIKQANGLKGPLAKHPVKRDLNKLKAVENLFKKFIKPAIETVRASSRHYAPNQTELKKYLSNSKFKVSVRILRQTLESSNGYDENSWWDLDDKTKKLIEKMGRVLYDIENKMEKANLESVNENLRPSDKKILMVIATELVKTHMKGKNKNKIRKELPDILSTMGTNDFSKKSPTNRFNKNKMISLGKGFDKLSDSDKKVFINTLMYNAGLAESINEKKKMFPPDKMTPKQAKEYKRFIDYAKMGIEYKIDMSLFESVNESKEPEVITQLRDIVKRQTNKKIKDPISKRTMRVDMFTASAITQVYDAVKKTSHKSKFESLPLDKMAQLSFKMMK